MSECSREGVDRRVESGWESDDGLRNDLFDGIVEPVEGGDSGMLNSKDGTAVRMLLVLGFRPE